MPEDQAPETPGLRLNRSRWRYAAATFAVGAAYMTVALLLGFELRVGGRDVTLLGGIVLELTFGLFGFWIGPGVEARGWERHAAAERESQLRQLSELHARLAQTEKLAVLGQVAGAIAHEVRNPLAIIRSLVQTLGDEAEIGDSTRATCREVVEEIDRLANVTRSLIGLARPVRLQRSTLAAGEASASGDSIELAASTHANQIRFAVADRGPGVPDAIRERIFEPFFTTRADGTGLGLAVARQIIEAHGGRLELDPD